jgi:hypothetical protein
LGQGNKGGSSRLPLGEERANILLLACCYQEGSNPGPGRFNRPAAGDAFAIGTVFDAVQSVLHLDQSLRRQGVFLERFGKTCGGSGSISKISYFGFTRNACFRFEACDVRLKFAFLLAQALFEAFDIHSSDDNPPATSQRLIALMALTGLAGVTPVAVYFSSHRTGGL